MADFIAVIRRAVDGLTDNTPDMRVKVYERARGAVQRQLENMKPRPPEAMLQRQLEKLEAAIREVESEHADALPAEDQAAAIAVPVAEAPAEPEAAPEPEVIAAAPEPAAEQAQEVPEAEPAYEQPAYEAPAREPAYEEPAYEEPAYEPPVEPEAPVAAEPVAHEEPLYEEPAPVPAPEVHEEPEVQPEPDVHYEPAPSYAEPVFEEETRVSAASEPEPVEPWQMPVEDQYDAARGTHGHDFAAAPDVEPYAEPVIDDAPRAQPVARDFDLSNRLVEPVPVFEPPHQFVEQTQDDPIHADAAGHFDPVWNEPAEEVPEPSTKTVEPTDWALEELRQFSETSHAAPAVNDAARAFDEVVSSIDYQSAPVAAAPAKMPAASESFSWEAAAFDDLPPIDNDKKAPAAAPYDDGDLFSEIHGGPTPKTEPLAGDDWQEATRLRGYDNRGVVAADDDGPSLASGDDDIASKFQGKNFRMEPKRRRFGIGSIIALLIALGVVGGGGYAAYTHQEALTEMVKGLVSSAPSQTAQTPPVAGTTAPADQTSEAKPAATPDTSHATHQDGAATDGSASGSKFTQRLLADGTEVDSGPAAAPSTQVAEGKSVAEQNVASSDPVAPAGAATPPAAASGTAAPGTTPTAAPADAQAAPAGASEKMFLYEERIGQSSPTAIQGSIAWSLRREAGVDGKQEASVQGTLTVPERNLTAQITFKRNSDPSLPASHIVEMVFSLPPNFEGGSIDSVQRISMKRTEQDRGDALVAVPAKITDDFHMIALNDYPDARKANLDLLSTREWIDIPITYRNGRRALLTMQKGPTGIEAFNTAIREWNAAGDVSTSQ